MIDENSTRDPGAGLSQKEIETILLGMRTVFGEAGRTSLARVLAGSKAKTVKVEWKTNPSYGAFLEKSQAEFLEEMPVRGFEPLNTRMTRKVERRHRKEIRT